MKETRLTGYRLKQRQYSGIYAVHILTIKRWMQQDVPLDDPRQVIGWLQVHRRDTWRDLPESFRCKSADEMAAAYEYETGDKEVREKADIKKMAGLLHRAEAVGFEARVVLVIARGRGELPAHSAAVFKALNGITDSVDAALVAMGVEAQ